MTCWTNVKFGFFALAHCVLIFSSSLCRVENYSSWNLSFRKKTVSVGSSIYNRNLTFRHVWEGHMPTHENRGKWWTRLGWVNSNIVLKIHQYGVVCPHGLDSLEMATHIKIILHIAQEQRFVAPILAWNDSDDPSNLSWTLRKGWNQDNFCASVVATCLKPIMVDKDSWPTHDSTP